MAPSPVPGPDGADAGGDDSGHVHVRGVERQVPGNQHGSGPDNRRAHRRVGDRRAEVRCERRGAQLRRQAFELAAAQGRQRTTVGSKRRRLVQEDRQAEVVGQRGADAARQQGAPLEGGGANGHEGTHVERPETGVRAVVSAHVDSRGDDLRQGEGRVADGLCGPDEGEDGAVRIGAAVHVQQPHPVGPRHRSRKGRHDVRVAALRHVRDARDERLFRHAVA